MCHFALLPSAFIKLLAANTENIIIFQNIDETYFVPEGTINKNVIKPNFLYNPASKNLSFYLIQAMRLHMKREAIKKLNTKRI